MAYATCISLPAAFLLATRAHPAVCGYRRAMSDAAKARVTVSRTIHTSPERVYAELSDAWMFTGWVVGASHIRDVDTTWPAVGARLYHSVGAWPATISDHTTILELDPPQWIVFQARAWPVGEARIELSIESDGDGGSIVTMAEWPVSGPGRRLRNPLQDRVLRSRNRESLSRLAMIAEKRPSSQGSEPDA